MKIGTSGNLRHLAYESYSPTRQARGGPKDVGYKKAGSLCHNEEPTVISRSTLNQSNKSLRAFIADSNLEFGRDKGVWKGK